VGDEEGEQAMKKTGVSVDIGAENTFTCEDLEFMIAWLKHSRERMGIQSNREQADKCIRLLEVALTQITPPTKQTPKTSRIPGSLRRIGDRPIKGIKQ
jgi:hypothetical protein